jgi:hypothetical protein
MHMPSPLESHVSASTYSKPMSTVRTSTGTGTGWLCGCCGCCRNQHPSPSGSIPVTPSINLPSGSPRTRASAAPCCCGLSVMAVIRIIFLILLLTSIIIGAFYFEELKGSFLVTLTYVHGLGPLRGSIVLLISNTIAALLLSVTTHLAG